MKSLLEVYVRHMLVNRRRDLTLKQVAEATGLSTTWLDNFIAGKNKEYTANKLECLYRYFVGRDLVL